MTSLISSDYFRFKLPFSRERKKKIMIVAHIWNAEKYDQIPGSLSPKIDNNSSFFFFFFSYFNDLFLFFFYIFLTAMKRNDGRSSARSMERESGSVHMKIASM
jgi:hypothetical protein